MQVKVEEPEGLGAQEKSTRTPRVQKVSAEGILFS